MSREIEKAGKESWLEEFSNYRPDLFYPDDWTDAQKAEAADLVRPSRMKSAMFANIPMQCTGPKCPLAKTCPLQQRGIAPIGKPCPIEMQQVIDFMNAFMDDLHVDEDNLIEVSMVRDLVDQEIQYARASKKLQLEDFIQDSVIGINENTGEPIFKKEMHLAVELQERILKRRKDLRNQLMATREQRAKIGQGKLDSAQTISDIFSQLREIEIEQEKVIRKKLGLDKVDAYITEAEVIEDSADND